MKRLLFALLLIALPLAAQEAKKDDQKSSPQPDTALMHMRAALSGSSWVARVLLAACGLTSAAQPPPPTAAEPAKVKSFLRSYLNGFFKAGDTTTRYFATSVDLTDSGRRDVIVYFTDQNSCGTGGCTTLILEPVDSTYKVLTSITIGWPPIRVLGAKINGWHDLGIWVEGGGIHPGYEARLQFDGKTYPRNPSVPPARPLVGRVAGRVVVPKDATGLPLY
jgi:hypothetical protein